MHPYPTPFVKALLTMVQQEFLCGKALDRWGSDCIPSTLFGLQDFWKKYLTPGILLKLIMDTSMEDFGRDLGAHTNLFRSI